MSNYKELAALRELARSIEPLIIHTLVPHDLDADMPDSFINMTFNDDPEDCAKWINFLEARAKVREIQGTAE